MHNGSERRDPLRAIFADIGERRRAGKHEVLHRAGDPPRYAYLLCEGWIGRTRANDAGETAFTAVHIAGDVIGLDVLSGGPLDDDVAALTEAAVLRVPIPALRERVAGRAEAAMVVVDLLAAEAAFLREALLAIGRQTSTERLSTFIAQTHGRLLAAGLVRPDATRFELPLTQVQLAAVTGMTGVHVNRVLRQLRDAGVMDVRGGMVRLGSGSDVAAERDRPRAAATA